MKHILMIATGGTIASKETADGLAPQLTSEELLAEVPELEQLCRIDTVQLMNRDSTNINSRDWLQMAACVRGHYDAYDGFVLTHGTDTMAYTAAALSYLIQNNAKPVVITGSQKSIFNQDTDARENLREPGASRPPTRRAMPRHLRHFRVPLQIEFSEQGTGTLLTLVCSDRPGLLAQVAAILREHRVRVHDARIATFGERAEDFFLLTDEGDQPLAREPCERLREAIRSGVGE